VAKEAAANGSRHVSLFFLSSAASPSGGWIATFLPFRSRLRRLPGRAPERVWHDRIGSSTKPLEDIRVTPLQIGSSRRQGREYPPGAGSVFNPKARDGREILVAGSVLGSGTTDSDCARLRLRAGASKLWAGRMARGHRARSRCLELGFEVDLESGLTVPAAG
jgi:hypothetical protein